MDGAESGWGSLRLLAVLLPVCGRTTPAPGGEDQRSRRWGTGLHLYTTPWPLKSAWWVCQALSHSVNSSSEGRCDLGAVMGLRPPNIHSEALMPV